MLLALLAAGCTARLHSEHWTAPAPPPDLLAALAAGDDEPAPLVDIDVLGLDADMRAFVANHVDSQAAVPRRLRQLLGAINASGRGALGYGEGTFTAGETFRRRTGNCLAFTSMFIALAREAGLDARFQEVDIPPEWSQSGDSMVLNRHVNALVLSDDGRSRAVDFNVEDFRVAYDQRAISDARAFAHFHSNIGVERMQAGETVAALAHYRRAIDYDAGYASTWINLGALFLRMGQEERAVAAWDHAARLSPDDTVPLSNLERVYRQRGELARADELSRRIQGHRQQNPYYRYFLAQQAFAAGDYGTAIGHLRFAIGRKPTDDRFYALLGMSYLRSGDSVAAQRWMRRAAAVAGDEESQRRYRNKLEHLQGAAG